MLADYFKPGIFKKIAAGAGTPVYVYSKAVFLKQIFTYKKAFRGLNALFCYALKANSNGALCALAAAQGVTLKEPARGDLVVIYWAGAYGFSMSSNYNSRLRAPEALITGPSAWRLIRKRETLRDLTAKEV